MECGTNTFVKGQCYTFNRKLEQMGKWPSKDPECPKSPIDIGFLIDGSGSVGSVDFNKMKQFIIALMRKFGDKNAQFSVTQYSRRVYPQFSFTDYINAPDKQNLVNQISQAGGGTRTFTALEYSANTMFEKNKGGRPGATRILITITDGESQDRGSHADRAVQAANRKNIKRYAVGVGRAFANSRAKIELKTIASSPEHVFAVSDFSALDGIQNELENRIFAIEGLFLMFLPPGFLSAERITHTQHILTHTHTLTYTHTQTHSHIHTHKLTLNHTQGYTNTHRHTLIHIHTHTLKHTHSHTPSLTHTQTHTHSGTHSHIHTQIHSHTHALTHSYTQTHTLTYILTHTHIHRLIH
uniref:VWFA domain-containing protein n=1 Tax=Callorhinchus milii TaxID=7868 RepID=A0A4W3H7F3_CALMI